MISSYEYQYIENLKQILARGSAEMNARTGVTTLRVPSTIIEVNLELEFPILRSKRVYWKKAVEEILWIMQKQSNNIKDLGNHIWDQWADKDGSIGMSYGAQIKKFHQIDYIIDTLTKDPSSRRAVIDMWNFADLDKMNLPPCVYSSVWTIIDGRLNCLLVQRSADYPIGVPFDTLQYAVLVHLLARHLKVRPGILTHVMADSHIYENQLGGVATLLNQFQDMKYTEMSLDPVIPDHNPKLVLNPEITNFYDFTMDDIKIVDYMSMPPVTFAIVV